MIKIPMTISSFFLPSLVLLVKNISYDSDQKIIFFWKTVTLVLFLLCFIYKLYFNKKDTCLEYSNIRIIDSKYNLHIFEICFLICSPVFLFEGNNKVEIIMIFILATIISKILITQKIYIMNFTLLIIGYKFYYAMINDEKERIICTKLELVELQRAISDNSSIYENSDGILYI